MLRQQVLKQYRDFLRLARLAEKESDRKEIRSWIRDDFKKNKHLTDEVWLGDFVVLREKDLFLTTGQ